MLCNALNPKIAVLFTSLLPRFVGDHATTWDFLLLGSVLNAMGLVLLITYALIAARGRAFLERPTARKVLDRLSGVVLVGLGLRLALERGA